MSEAAPAIEVKELTKRYGPTRGRSGVVAVDHISFRVQQGEFFGFLGPNGAGKTTTIRMLTGLTRPTSGTMRVGGVDVARRLVDVKERMGVVSDVANLYNEMSAGDNLDFVARLHGMPRNRRIERVEELLHFLGLGESRHRRTGTFSTGERKRLMIAAALVHEPEILFLDEPTTGLDVRSARRIRQMLRELNDEGVTIFLTTHLIEEADQLCQRIAIIDQGKLVTEGTPEGLKSLIDRREVIDVTFDRAGGQIAKMLDGLDDVEEVIVLGQRARLHVKSPSRVLPVLVKAATDNELKIVALNTTRLSLEDAFVALTGLHPEGMMAETGASWGERTES